MNLKQNYISISIINYILLVAYITMIVVVGKLVVFQTMIMIKKTTTYDYLARKRNMINIAGMNLSSTVNMSV